MPRARRTWRAACRPPRGAGLVPGESLVGLPERRPSRAAAGIAGHVVTLDRFGHARTDIPTAWLADRGPSSALTVHSGARRLERGRTSRRERRRSTKKWAILRGFIA